MTKEEAEKLVNDAWPRYQISGNAQNAANSMGALGTVTSLQPMTPAIFVKLAVVLGMLKLDEPKSVNERAMKAMIFAGYTGLISPMDVLRTLDANGLKIVEK